MRHSVIYPSWRHASSWSRDCALDFCCWSDFRHHFGRQRLPSWSNLAFEKAHCCGIVAWQLAIWMRYLWVLFSSGNNSSMNICVKHSHQKRQFAIRHYLPSQLWSPLTCVIPRHCPLSASGQFCLAPFPCADCRGRTPTWIVCLKFWQINRSTAGFLIFLQSWRA